MRIKTAKKIEFPHIFKVLLFWKFIQHFNWDTKVFIYMDVSKVMNLVEL